MTGMAVSSDAGAMSSAGSGGGAGAAPDAFALEAKIVSTSNQLEEEPWLPVRNIVTMYRIQAVAGDTVVIAPDRHIMLECVASHQSRDPQPAARAATGLAR